MMRRVVGILVCVVVVGLPMAELIACGDKFLRPGRSPRLRAYAAIYQADILLYAPNASPENVSRYQRALGRSGHRTQAVRTLDEMRTVLAGASFDLVIAPVAEAPPVQAFLAGVASPPEVLPIVGKVPRAERDVLEQTYPHMLEEGNTDVEAITEINHVMEARLKGRALPASR